MAVRGLGCPVRITLTAGQKGDAPQAAALIEGLAAAAPSEPEAAYCGTPLACRRNGRADHPLSSD
jgi:hypothetical protein